MNKNYASFDSSLIVCILYQNTHPCKSSKCLLLYAHQRDKVYFQGNANITGFRCNLCVVVYVVVFAVIISVYEEDDGDDNGD